MYRPRYIRAYTENNEEEMDAIRDELDGTGLDFDSYFEKWEKDADKMTEKEEDEEEWFN